MYNTGNSACAAKSAAHGTSCPVSRNPRPLRPRDQERRAQKEHVAQERAQQLRSDEEKRGKKLEEFSQRKKKTFRFAYLRVDSQSFAKDFGKLLAHVDGSCH